MSDYYQFRDETGEPIDYYQLVNDNGELCKEIERLQKKIDKALEILEDENIRFPSAKEWRNNLKKILKGGNNE